MLRRCIPLLVFTILLAALFPAHTPAATGGNRLWLVRIAATPAEATQLEQLGVDLVEARDGPDVLALVDDRQIGDLQDAGWDVRPQRILAGPGAARPATFRDGYRTVAEVTELLDDWNTRYPALVELESYGVTWEREQQAHLGYDLLALRLTDEQVNTPKARLVVMAAIHARELVTTEIVLRWAEELLTGFATDPPIATLLRTREIWLIPLANPDGRIRAQQGIYWRKNINDIDAPCVGAPDAFSQPGVDLNRNSSWQWGVIDTPQTSPCAQTYPGMAAASEPEVEALQALLTRLFPPRADDTDTVGCANRRRDTPGLLISLHSYGDLVLYPWGYTTEPACMAAELDDLAGRFAAFNGYQTGQPPNLLYATSGTTDDWAYGALGIASYTFEIGPSDSFEPCADFFPPFACVDTFYALNRGALMHAAEVADDPYGGRVEQTNQVYVPLIAR